MLLKCQKLLKLLFFSCFLSFYLLITFNLNSLKTFIDFLHLRISSTICNQKWNGRARKWRKSCKFSYLNCIEYTESNTEQHLIELSWINVYGFDFHPLPWKKYFMKIQFVIKKYRITIVKFAYSTWTAWIGFHNPFE